jgi:ribosome biogenesis protein ENP2
LSADRKGCRIYDLETCQFFTSFETRAVMTCVLPFPNSGLIFAGVETEKVQVMIIPELGPAPRAFSFIGSLVQDVEFTPLHDDQKFVTRQEIEEYGMTQLLSGSVLRPYMHGFFVPRDLYQLIKEKGEAPGDEDFSQRTRTRRRRRTTEGTAAAR